MTRFAKRGLIHHSFMTQLSSPFDSYINRPTAHVFNILKVEQSAFTHASFSSLSDVHECSGSLQLALSSLDRQTTDCDSPHDSLISSAMALAALCDM